MTPPRPSARLGCEPTMGGRNTVHGVAYFLKLNRLNEYRSCLGSNQKHSFCSSQGYHIYVRQDTYSPRTAILAAAPSLFWQQPGRSRPR
jgi:hypothetical protein